LLVAAAISKRPRRFDLVERNVLAIEGSDRSQANNRLDAQAVGV
jgi:hypothetical protein